MLPRSSAAIVLIASLFIFIPVSAQTTCGTGKHMSTSEDVAKGLPANTCVDDSISSYLNGGCGSNPYDMLKSGGYIKGGQVQPVSSGSGPSDASLRQGIDPALACRLFKFFEATKAKGCSVKIISAYRSAQQQEDMCGSGRSGCAAAGRSCHQYGLAVDVETSCIGWLRAAAPQFQLVFPYYGQHIQCAEHPVAACSTNTKPCNGGIQITPDLSRIPNPSQVPSTYFVPPAAASNPFGNSSAAPLMQNAPVTPTPYQPQANANAAPYSYPTPTPTPDSTQSTTNTTYTSPSLYTNTSSATSGTAENNNAQTTANQLAVLTTAASTSTSNNTGQSTQTSQPGSTQLNSNLGDSTSIGDNGSNSTGGGTGSNGNGSTGSTIETSNVGTVSGTLALADTRTDTIASTSVPLSTVHVTGTFGEPLSQAQTATSGLSADQNKSLILALLTTLRDFLLSYLNFLKSRSTYGFQGAWQMPASVPVYR